MDIGEVEKKFLSMAPRTYKNLLAILAELKIPYEEGTDVVKSSALETSTYATCKQFYN